MSAGALGFEGAQHGQHRSIGELVAQALLHVGHEEEGRQHRYFASVQRQAAQRSALNHLLSKLFKDSSELLFARLVSDQKLSPEQIRQMRRLLAGKSNKDGS